MADEQRAEVIQSHAQLQENSSDVHSLSRRRTVIAPGREESIAIYPDQDPELKLPKLPSLVTIIIANTLLQVIVQYISKCDTTQMTTKRCLSSLLFLRLMNMLITWVVPLPSQV